MALYKRGGIWWIDLRHRGRRIRRTTGTADKAVAKRQNDELAARLWKERQTGRRLTDALLRWLKAGDRSRQELSAIKEIRATYEDRALIDVDAASFSEAFAGKTPGTYNRIATILRAAMRGAERAGWIERAPHIDRRRERPTDPRFLTAEEWTALHAELPAHLKTMAEFSIRTGLRWSNVANLQWRQVSLERRLVWVPASKAKGGKAIPVPLSTAAIAALQATGDERTGFVFTYRGKPLRSAKTAWLGATKRAGLDGFRWHDLRHTWASWHAMSGTPLGVLQKLGAWASQDMVQRYAHFAPEHLASYADNAIAPTVGTIAPLQTDGTPRQ